MAEPRYLVDTSVLARADIDLVGERLEQLALSGRLWSCCIVDLEVGFASRARDVDDVLTERHALPEAPITPAVMDRALAVLALLATAGHHRGAKPTDLVIAAAAESAGLAILHYDDDFDRIAAVTHQPSEWIAAAGSLRR